MNQAVTLETCSIAHGNLTVVIQGDAADSKAKRTEDRPRQMRLQRKSGAPPAP